ncbi:MAG: S-methyl-5-thioribose-1-phosphate isomerase, partial [Candidatus Bathyarchaeia archaeon]
MRTVRWENGVVVTIDQTMLPHKEEWIKLRSCNEVATAIKEMRVRGAPLIGVMAAYGLALTAYHSKARSVEELLREIELSANMLKETRPTAVNLFWAIDRILNKVKSSTGGVEELRHIVIEEAQRIADEDVEVNKRIGEYGSELLEDGDTVLTHCNAGRLATVDYGTALSIIRVAWEKG